MNEPELTSFGVCETCSEKMGVRRYPLLADKDEAVRMSYISCDECFEAVWAGEL